MSVTIQLHEDLHFSAHHGDHQVIIDLPESHGGNNRGMSPPQLFIAALGACVGVYVADYCDEHVIPYQGMRLVLDWKYRDKPHRIGKVCVRLELPSDGLRLEHERGIKDSVQRCLLHNTLAHTVEFDVEVVPTDSVATPRASAVA